MINFFRRIRNLPAGKAGKMSNDNKPLKPAWPVGRYAKYAIGEILLVVVGILIALQINNWNEERKLAQMEISLLNDIRSNLEQNIVDMEYGMGLNRNTLKHYKKIYSHLEKKLPYSKDLDSSFGLMINWHSPFFTRTAYETLKNKGMDLISNKELRYRITELYEMEYSWLVQDYDRGEWVFSQGVKEPIINKHLRYSINEQNYSFGTAIPVDYEKLLNDPEFLNMLSRLIKKRNSGLRRYQAAIIKTEETIQLIDQELISRR